MRTLRTITKMTVLKHTIARTGPKNRPKNTPMWLMKQLNIKRKVTNSFDHLMNVRHLQISFGDEIVVARSKSS